MYVDYLDKLLAKVVTVWFLVKLLYNNGYLLCCEGTNLSNTHSYYRYREIEIMIVEG